MKDADIIVAGAGIVGTSTALWLQLRGHSVILVDPNPPGSGTSSGNACTLATYGCVPVNSPAVLAGLFGLLTSHNSPLSISPTHALRNPFWMLSFLANCRKHRSKNIAESLAALLSHADAGLNPLIAEAGAEDLIEPRGQLTLWSTNKAATGDRASLELRRSLGVSVQELTSEEARSLEPGVDLPVVKGALFPEARHVKDPVALVSRFITRFKDLGGQVMSQKVQSVTHRSDGVLVQLDDHGIFADKLVIASGAFSDTIVGAGTRDIPLGVERGYHILFEDHAHRISRPVGWSEGGFYAVPVTSGLRLAGTVELAPVSAPPNPKRLAYLKRRAHEMFENLPEPNSSWLGFRPTLPDSLPVIGKRQTSDRIIHAFGHQHLGLTLSGITGRVVADLVEGRQSNLPLSAYRPDRRYW